MGYASEWPLLKLQRSPSFQPFLPAVGVTGMDGGALSGPLPMAQGWYRRVWRLPEVGVDDIGRSRGVSDYLRVQEDLEVALAQGLRGSLGEFG